MYMHKIKYISMDKIKSFTRKHILKIVGVIVGAIGGYAYYYFIGCNSGGCPITSNPNISIMYGAVLGYLFLDMFSKKDKKEDVSKD
jgi:hypothetical protein